MKKTLVWAAIGMAVTYYTGPLLAPRVLLVGVLALVLFYAAASGTLGALVYLSQLNALNKGPRCFLQDAASVKWLRVLLCAGCIGVFVGLACRDQVALSLGLPRENIVGFSGILRDDPRAVASRRGEQGRATLSLRRTRGRGKVETSARGDIAVIFPEHSISNLKEFGRGSSVYIEGAFLETKSGTPLFIAESTHIFKPAPPLETLRTSVRQNIAARFAGFDWEGLGLALLLGMRDELDTELATRYRKAGCVHVLALSGMHLALICVALSFCLKKPLGLKVSSLTSAVFIVLYLFLVGALPSLNRAAIMYILGIAILIFKLPKDTLSVLALSFILQICFQQSQGRLPSFILSYASLVGIVLLHKPIHELLRGWLPDLLGQALSVSSAAFLGTATIGVALFSELHPIGIVAGLVIIPLSSLFMLGVLIALILSFIAPPLFACMGEALSVFYGFLENIVHFASLPGGIYTTKVPLILGLNICAVILVLCLNYWIRYRICPANVHE